MEKAGMPNQTVFPHDILSEIHLRSQGIPRLINGICDNLLLTCFAMEARTATIDMLEEVSNDMRLEWQGRRPRGRSPLRGRSDRGRSHSLYAGRLSLLEGHCRWLPDLHAPQPCRQDFSGIEMTRWIEKLLKSPHHFQAFPGK